MARRVLPAVLLVAALSGCEAFSPTRISLPPEEQAAVRAGLEAQSIMLEAASDEQIVAAVRPVLAPLPVESATEVDGSVQVVIAPLSTPILAQLLGGLGAGGIAGLAGSAAAGGVSLFLLVQKLRDLKRRSNAAQVPTVTPTPVVP